MITINYFAVTNANGLISQVLLGETRAEAIAEVKAAVADRSAVNWIDDAQTDIEDALDCCCDGMAYAEALAHCESLGAEPEWGEDHGDTWAIWSVSEEL